MKTNIIVVLLFIANSVCSQNVVVKQAEFVGGKEALTNYLKENLIYPEQAKRSGIEGYFKISLAIDDKGKPIFSDFLEQIPNCEECEKEALRLINRMPKWNPKTVNEKPTYSSAVVTIIFELQEGNVKLVEEARAARNKKENESIVTGSKVPVK